MTWASFRAKYHILVTAPGPAINAAHAGSERPLTPPRAKQKRRPGDQLIPPPQCIPRPHSSCESTTPVFLSLTCLLHLCLGWNGVFPSEQSFRRQGQGRLDHGRESWHWQNGAFSFVFVCKYNWSSRPTS